MVCQSCIYFDKLKNGKEVAVSKLVSGSKTHMTTPHFICKLDSFQRAVQKKWI
jgi:hypothetical protein